MGSEIMIGDDEITIEELLEKFNIDLNLPIFILTRKVYDIYTKCIYESFLFI